MRNEVTSFLAGQDLGSYTLATEVPYDSTGTPLYLKNPKRIYVGLDQVTTELFIGVLGQDSIDMEIYSVTVFFSNDAKILPTDYNDVVTIVKSAKEVYKLNGHFRRDFVLSTEITNDLMTTAIELRFYKIV